MEYEIELKLSTRVQAGTFIESCLLPKLAASVEQRELELSNSYFDTAQRDFRKNGMGLRIRGCQHEYEQTIKTAGNSVAGLAQRPEYNVALGKGLLSPPALPDLSLFPAEIWPANFELNTAQAQLHCLFETHFKRTVYLLTFNADSQIELVWDRGQVRANNKQEEINEVELELKQGKVSQLFTVARELAQVMPLKIGLLSKAARGYRLLKAETQTEKSSPELKVSFNESKLDNASITELHDYLAERLKCWQLLINLFDAEPNAKHFNAVGTVWLQLSLLLAKCVLTQQSNVQLKTDVEHFNQAWQGVLLKQQDVSDESQQWSAAVVLLTGQSAIVLQLAIMQHLVEQQSSGS